MKRMRHIQRLLTAFVALAYTVGSLLISLHYVENSHSVCIEHQEIHHIAHSDVTDSASGPPSHDIRGIELSEDDHCELVQLHREKTLAVLPPASVLQLEAVARLANPRPPVLSGFTGIATWRYAPKQSPPTV